MEKIYLEFSNDLKRYLSENMYEVTTILRNDKLGYKVTTGNNPFKPEARGEITIIELFAITVAANVAADGISAILKFVWNKIRILTQNKVQIEDEDENVLIDEEGNETEKLSNIIEEKKELRVIIKTPKVEIDINRKSSVKK
jgi:hypothetical protein